MIRRVSIVLSLLLLAAPAPAADRNLDRWFEQELVPFVTSQLTEHPRFKGESVMFVVFEDGVPASVSSKLAISLRDRLLDAALNTPGVSVGRRQGGTNATPGSQSVDCTHDDVHYYIGISVSRRIDGLYGVNVRALDLEDRNWVSGFGNSWQGALTYRSKAMSPTCLPLTSLMSCRARCCARRAGDTSSLPIAKLNRATTSPQQWNW